MNIQRILVVEDSEDSFALIRHAIGNIAELVWAQDLKSAHQKLNEKSYSLILLDLDLPDGDGMAFCSVLQTSEALAHIPVVLITARDSMSDKIMGFAVGADDYVTKPFHLLELRSRIETKLKKIEIRDASAMLIRIHGIEIDRDKRTVTIPDGEERVQLELTSKEFMVLVMFASNPGKIFSRQEVIEKVWGKNIFIGDRIVDTHTSKTKKKLGVLGDVIETVHGVGYRMRAIKS